MTLPIILVVGAAIQIAVWFFIFCAAGNLRKLTARLAEKENAIRKSALPHLRLPWKLCDCGCGLYHIDVGDFKVFMWWNLNDKWCIGTSHAESIAQKEPFRSPSAAEEAVCKTLQRRQKEKDADSLAIRKIVNCLEKE